MPNTNIREVDYGVGKKIVKKEVNYLGRDFADIRANLIEFKTYFPNQYNDFNEHHQYDVCWDAHMLVMY